MGKDFAKLRRQIIDDMIQIYRPDLFDWMYYQISKNNRISFHHIVEERNGGKLSIENGAILTLKSHADLNQIELLDKYLYVAWNELFQDINLSSVPPSETHRIEMQKLKIYTNKTLYK
jgi:hypothetical protein